MTTRLCLDRLRSRTPVPVGELPDDPAHDLDGPVDPAELAVLADTVGVALQVVLDRLGPRERVAFVLHDTFGFTFPTIAGVLGTTPVNARKLASRARAKVAQPAPEDRRAEAEVVDAFMAAAREGDLARLLRLLAPDAVVGADAAALAAGTPDHLEGREAVAAFFDGSARGALPVEVDGRPAAAWVHRGEVRVLFDVEVRDGLVASITFRADPAVLSRVVRRRAGVTPGLPTRQGSETTPDGPPGGPP